MKRQTAYRLWAAWFSVLMGGNGGIASAIWTKHPLLASINGMCAVLAFVFMIDALRKSLRATP